MNKMEHARKPVIGLLACKRSLRDSSNQYIEWPPTTGSKGPYCHLSERWRNFRIISLQYAQFLSRYARLFPLLRKRWTYWPINGLCRWPRCGCGDPGSPNHRRQGIARAFVWSFEKETASYPIESVTFQTERVFSRDSSWFCQQLGTGWGWRNRNLVRTWSNRLCIRFPFGCRCALGGTFLSWSHCPAPPQTFSDEVEAPEVSHRYISEALKDPDSLLYIAQRRSSDWRLYGGCIWKMQLPLWTCDCWSLSWARFTEAIWQNPSSTNSLSKMIRHFRLQWKTAMWCQTLVWKDWLCQTDSGGLHEAKKSRNRKEMKRVKNLWYHVSWSARIYPHRGRKGPHVCLWSNGLQLYPREGMPAQRWPFDTIRRYFEYRGYEVAYISNLQMWMIRSSTVPKKKALHHRKWQTRYIAAFVRMWRLLGETCNPPPSCGRVYGWHHSFCRWLDRKRLCLREPKAMSISVWKNPTTMQISQ